MNLFLILGESSCHEFEQALGDGKGQGRLVCCSAWGCKESDVTEQKREVAVSNACGKSLSHVRLLVNP